MLTFIVDHYLLIVMKLFLMLFGIVVLLYYMTSYYSLRGGNSNEGLTCGIWMTFLRTGTSDIRWYIGAALSFKIKIYL